MSTFEPFNRQKNCRYGQMLYNFHDRYIGRALDVYGEYSEGEIELFRQVIKPGQAVVEVGANIGAHTVFFAGHVGLGGRVMAFEPQRVVFQTLCANLALNSITNVRCQQQAVSDQCGTLKVPPLNYLADNNFGGLALGNHRNGEIVSVVTLDSLNLPRCDFLKIDVEGMELQVLSGAHETLARLKPILYVENDETDRERSGALVRHIDALGYRMFRHWPTCYNPANFLANPDNIFPGVVSKNMLCVHRDAPECPTGLESIDAPPAA